MIKYIQCILRRFELKRSIFTCFCFVFLLASCTQNKKNNEPTPTNKEEPKPAELTFKVGNVSFNMRLIEAVKKTTLSKGSQNERVVSLSPYYIAETEVTQELFNAVMGYNPSAFDNSDEAKAPAQGEVQEKRPVETLSWYDAVAFCNKLTETINGNANECVYTLTDIEKDDKGIFGAKVAVDVKKKGFRLPTEAEFEYAAKGGVEDIIYAGANHDDEKVALKEVAWFNENSNKRTHQVGIKKANGYGLFDMSGNVFEWCQDNYSNPMVTNVEQDPQGTRKDTGRHAAKGGGYGNGGFSQCYVSARSPTNSEATLDDIGFRIVIRK